MKNIYKESHFLLKSFYQLVFKFLCLYPHPTKLEGGYTGFTLSVRSSVHPSVCRRHGFQSISQVCFRISFWNFICVLMVVIGRGLLIFSNVTFKMATWIFWFPDFTLPSNINILTPNFSGTILMYISRSLVNFSSVFCKMAAWRPYWIFRTFFLDLVGGMVSGA